MRSGARGINTIITQLWTDFLVRYFRYFLIYPLLLCLCRLVPEIQVWKHVLLLGIVHIGGQGGLGHWGRLGAPIFTLTVRKSSLPGLDFHIGLGLRKVLKKVLKKALKKILLTQKRTQKNKCTFLSTQKSTQ